VVAALGERGDGRLILVPVLVEITPIGEILGLPPAPADRRHLRRGDRARP
jgi:hypothetical protein